MKKETTALMTLEEMEEFFSEEETVYNIILCHGRGRCATYNKDAEEKPVICEWCYRLTSDDPRSIEEIKEDVFKTQ